MDNELFALINAEALYQQTTIRLIPSENYASKAVMDATGSILTNKYSEGYPGKRYYQGQKFIDRLENLAIDRVKQVFGAEHANVQPYSGSIAVLASYFAVCKPGDTVMGCRLDHGGHLSHGHKVNVTGQLFNIVHYGVNKDSERVDVDEVRALALENKPRMIIVGGTAFPRNMDYPAFGAIAREVGAVLVADVSHVAGLIAGGSHPNPFPHADILVSTSHKTLRGPRGAFIACKAEYAKAVDRAVFPLLQGGPHQHTQAGIATALYEAQQPAYKDYAHQIVKNAQALAGILKQGGLRLITGGTENHLILADVTPLGWSDGRTAAVALEKAGIVLNYNTIPYDKGTAMRPNGIRLGTPSITTRGFKEPEAVRVGSLMMDVLKNPAITDAELEQIRRETSAFAEEFPVPPYFV